MQYILDETEMEEIRQLRKSLKFLPSVEELQKMCTKIADEWPVWRGWVMAGCIAVANIATWISMPQLWWLPAMLTILFVAMYILED